MEKRSAGGRYERKGGEKTEREGESPQVCNGVLRHSLRLTALSEELLSPVSLHLHYTVVLLH